VAAADLKNHPNSTECVGIKFQYERGIYGLWSVFGCEFDKARIRSN
jgi:hypothetical protein